MRLDVYLCSEGVCESRNKASALILDDKVKVNGKIINKPSYNVPENAVIDVDKSFVQYVSRSAKKLLTAIDVFSVDFSNKTAIDFAHYM